MLQKWVSPPSSGVLHGIQDAGCRRTIDIGHVGVPGGFGVPQASDGPPVHDDVGDGGDVGIGQLVAFGIPNPPHGRVFQRSEALAERLHLGVVEALATQAQDRITTPDRL